VGAGIGLYFPQRTDQLFCLFDKTPLLLHSFFLRFVLPSSIIKSTMGQPEKLYDQETEILERYQIRLARIALFDELIDLHHDGQCTFDEAVQQFLHDTEIGGIGYEQATS
jgi:hypothetical protein